MPEHRPPAAPPSPSAETLAREAQAGDTASFEALVERFEGPLFQFLRVRTGNADEAEELAQEAFLRAWTNLHRYDSRWRFSTWLFTVAKRLAASRHRRRAGRTEQSADVLEGVAVDADPASIAGVRDEQGHLWRTADRVLKVEQRSALWLRYAEERTVEEIANILGKRRVTVRVLLFRAREALGKHLSEPAPSSSTRAARRAPLRSGPVSLAESTVVGRQ